jgi:hypothetical protein
LRLESGWTWSVSSCWGRVAALADDKITLLFESSAYRQLSAEVIACRRGIVEEPDVRRHLLGGKAFYEKWFTSKPLLPGKQQEIQQQNRSKKARELLKRYDDVQEFIDDVASTGIAENFISRLQRAFAKLSKYKTAVELGVDAAEAAEEVSALMEWYNEACRGCKKESEATGNDYFTCIAAVDRQWQATSIKATLDVKASDSVVRKVFEKWESRLLALIPSGY